MVKTKFDWNKIFEKKRRWSYTISALKLLVSVRTCKFGPIKFVYLMYFFFVSSYFTSPFEQSEDATNRSWLTMALLGFKKDLTTSTSTLAEEDTLDARLHGEFLICFHFYHIWKNGLWSFIIYFRDIIYFHGTWRIAIRHKIIYLFFTISYSLDSVKLTYLSNSSSSSSSYYRRTFSAKLNSIYSWKLESGSKLFM